MSDSCRPAGALLAFAVICVATALAGCGGGAAATATIPIQSGEEAAERTEPDPHPPQAPPPNELVVEDLIEGDGAEAELGDQVTLEYVGVNWLNLPYASSWEYRAPPSFQLGTHRLLPGLTKAIEGMKEGGRRRVVIPSDLQLYPDEKDEEVPTDALLYIVDLLKVE